MIILFSLLQTTQITLQSLLKCHKELRDRSVGKYFLMNLIYFLFSATLGLQAGAAAKNGDFKLVFITANI